MKRFRIRFLLIPVALLLAGVLICARTSGPDVERQKLIMKLIDFALVSGHYNPQELNDEFSKKAYNLFLERLDYGKKFLLQEDVNRLRKYETRIDDELRSGTFEFLDLASELLEERTKEIEKLYPGLLAHKFDFAKDEHLEVDDERQQYASNHTALEQEWRKQLKYEVLARLYDMKNEQEQAAQKSDTVRIRTDEELEKDARDKVLKRYNELFHRFDQLNGEDIFALYASSIVNVFDPHSDYFPPRDKENFDIQMSGQLEGIGAQLTQKNAYIEVIRIVPGSPSWKQGELQIGDIILKVAQGDDAYVDVVDMRLDDAVKLIRGKKGTRVRLTIKKLDGLIKEITLIRDVVQLEETYARSGIIEDKKSDNRIGYLRLPSFYADFDTPQGRRCSDDVKAEIEKLRAENVTGIIFDLRGNEGGSLEDVVKIAGYFIKEGPVVQVMSKGGSKRVLSDTDPDVDFGGPLVVMVNSQSASASEIFAAAMQDYQRGIIIGGNSTFGKGSVQTFAELDRMVGRKPGDMRPLGSLKLTFQKFYRINGASTQIKGVTPDIVMPDYYNYLDFGEQYMDYPLAWDETTPASYSEITPTYDLAYIEQMSQSRILSDSLFILINENAKRLKGIREETVIPLDYKDYEALMDKRTAEGKKYERIGKDTLGLAVRLLKADLKTMKTDTASTARTDAWLLSLRKDVYLREAVNVMADVVENQKSSAIKNE